MLARRNLSDIGPSMLRSMKKGRLINIWIACSVRKSCVTKSWFQFLVTCWRSSAAEAKLSSCSCSVPLPWNACLGDTGEGRVDSRDKNEFVNCLALRGESTSKRLKLRGLKSTIVSELPSSVSMKENRWSWFLRTA